MSSILYGIHTKQVLLESCQGLDRDQRYIVEGIYNEFKPIIEATLSADQIGQLFTNVEKSVTAAGGNRTMLGKGIDAGKAINQAIDNVGKWLQNTKPVQAFDQKYENLKTKISAKFPGLEKNLTAMGTWAKENPGKTAAIIGVLTTVAALAGGPAGGAIAGQILRGTTELLKGEKISTAVGKGVKTAAMGALAGYGIDKIGDMLSGGVRMVADNLFPGAQKLNLSFSAYGTGPSTFQNIPDVVGRAKDLAPIQSAFQNASEAWNSGNYGKAYTLFQQAKDAAAKLSDPAFVAQLTKDQEARSAIMQGAKGIMQASDAFAAAAQGAASGAGEGGLKKQTAESKNLSDKEVKLVFEGVMSWLGKKAGNLTTKITADKLMSAWKKAGSPTDSTEIATFLTQNGVSKDIVDNVFAQMKVSTQAAPAQQATPKPQAQPKAQATPKPQAQARVPAQQPAQPQKPVAGTRSQGGAFAYNPLAEGDFEVNVPGYGTMPLEMLKRHVKELTKDFNDTVQGEEFIKAAYRTEQLYNALFALSKAMKAKSKELDETHSTGTTAGSAGIGGGAGLGIEKTPIEKVIEKPLGEHINSPGGMGQSYRKFTPKSAGIAEMDSQGYKGHRGDEDPGKGPEKVVKPAKTKDVAKDATKVLNKAMDKSHKKGVAEEQAPMFTPEEKLNELSPDTLAKYKKAAGADARKADSEGDYKRGNKRFSGIVRATKKEFDHDAKKVKKESSIMKGLQNEVKGNGSSER